MKEVLDCFTKNYCNFKGRASRKEYWLYYLITTCFGFAVELFGLSYLSALVNHKEILFSFTPLLINLVTLFLIIPGFAVAVRRLHDTGRKGWFLFLLLIPIVGPIWFLVLLCLKGNKGPNAYGDDPHGATLVEVS